MTTALQKLTDTMAGLDILPTVLNGEAASPEQFVRHVLSGARLTPAQMVRLLPLLLASVLELHAETIRLRSLFTVDFEARMAAKREANPEGFA